ncbi:MAG: hypothetical protein WDO13_18735, partial [Verrucomicrobiota bacterium]
MKPPALFPLVLLLAAPAAALAQSAPGGASPAVPPTGASSTHSVTAPAGQAVTQLDPIVVTGELDTARDQIAPDLGATVYTISSSQIATQSQGDKRAVQPDAAARAR